MIDFDIVVVGAGVVGLAIASELSSRQLSVLVIEKNKSFGMESSSRNSEVIHGGMYYQSGLMKAKFCVEGRRLLYSHCDNFRVPYKKIGKYIFAVNENEIPRMRKILEQGINNGVENFYEDSVSNLQKFNPGVKATACLFSAESGIIDSHKLMESFIEITKSFSGEIAYLHQLIGIEKSQDTYRCKLQCGSDKFFISTKYLINCGGLNSDKIAKMAGIDVIKEKLDLSYCKGRYYRLHSSKKSIATNLIYPIPPENYSGLGIHLTIDLAGELKLGPDTVYMEENIQNYEVEDVKDKFFAAAKTYLNGISIDDLSPDQSGIRAKLQKQGESIRDFYIANESKYGFDNFINLIGIESPGLTSSLAIAKYISENLVE